MSDNEKDVTPGEGTNQPQNDGVRRRRRRRRRSSSQAQTTESQPTTNQEPEAPASESSQSASQEGADKPSGAKRRRRRRRSSSSGSAPAQATAQTGSPAESAPQRRPHREDDTATRSDPRRSRHGGAPQQQAQNVGRAPAGTLRVIPLGGVGEVGKNMTVVEYERDLILLDVGGKFPEDDQIGIDLIIPDVTYVKQRLSSLRGILITHGHEDHIGGLPYILNQIKGKQPIPIYGSALALGFIENKLNEHRLLDDVELHVVSGGDKIRLGQLTAEFIHVTHSIPDTNAIAVTSPVGTIVDTADFKFDPTPVMGGPTDERALSRLGQKGVLALFSDTVRVEVDGTTPSERVVHEKMGEVIRDAKGQVLIATFASNISRIFMALQAAEKHGRKVAVAGRSMEQNARTARQLGYLAPPEGLFVSLDEILKLPKDKRVIVLTGSQGESAAALARIAAAEHPKLRVGVGDTVLVSASPVPGNEESVTRTIDNLFRRGATVIYSGKDKGVHVSGHGGRDELRKMIDLLKPKYAVPIHGEFRHMALYRDLCAEAGITPDRVFFPEIGGVIEFTKDGARTRGRVPAGSVLVDRIGEQGRGPVKLRNPETMTEEGVVIVTVAINKESGQLIAGPEIVGKGLKPELNASALKAAEGELRAQFERQAKGEAQSGYLAQRAKETVGRSLLRRSKSRPLILPVIIAI
jgi:ribonuclease J